MQYNPVLLNRNVAPGISEFTEANIQDLRPSFPEAEHWLSNHFLNTLFGSNYRGSFRQYAINMLSRAQAQFAFFHQAREATHVYLQKGSPHNPAIRRYFAAVVLWESCFLNYQIFIDLFTKATGRKAFTTGDGSEEQRAYGIANIIKHWGGVIKANQHDDNYTIPMWLSNTGFNTHSLHLTYVELAAITTEVAKAADDLQNPGAVPST
jgi:hypothetical protein